MNGFTAGIQQARKQTFETVKKLWSERDVKLLYDLVRQYELSGQRTDWDAVSGQVGQTAHRCKEKYWREHGNVWDKAVEQRLVLEVRNAFKAGDKEINWKVMEAKFNKPTGVIQKYFKESCPDYFTPEDDAKLLHFADSTDRQKPHWAEMQRALGLPAGACFQRFKALCNKTDIPEEALAALRATQQPEVQQIADKYGVRVCYLKQKLRDMNDNQ